MKFFNSLGRTKQEFVTIREGHAGVYTCGLTVYERGHIGNFRAYIFSDILQISADKWEKQELISTYHLVPEYYDRKVK